MALKLSPYRGWTEAELHADIRRIGARIQRTEQRRDERSRCATSYLNQLLRDREDSLATLLVQGKSH